VINDISKASKSQIGLIIQVLDNDTKLLQIEIYLDSNTTNLKGKLQVKRTLMNLHSLTKRV
jgi:hypothetical protein